jgi:hypothetical protein
MFWGKTEYEALRRPLIIYEPPAGSGTNVKLLIVPIMLLVVVKPVY